MLFCRLLQLKTAQALQDDAASPSLVSETIAALGGKLDALRRQQAADSRLRSLQWAMSFCFEHDGASKMHAAAGRLERSFLSANLHIVAQILESFMRGYAAPLGNSKEENTKFCDLIQSLIGERPLIKEVEGRHCMVLRELD